MFSRLAICAALLIITACTPTLESKAFARGDDALIFEKFKALAGTFVEVEGVGEPATVEYRLISRGTALTETWIMPKSENAPNGGIELTVFHMDNGVLVATHYCAAGINPTMTLAQDSPAGEYNFEPRQIANLSSPDQSHNSGFGYRFEGEDTVFRSEQWTISGEQSTYNLRMVRAPDGSR